MDRVNNVFVHQQNKLNEEIAAEVLSISSNSSICSDFCGFKELQDVDMPLHKKNNYLKDMQDFKVEATANMNNRRMDAINFNADINRTTAAVAVSNDAKKRYFVSEMELLPAEEIFEVNSNSTTDTIRRQRLERNKELRLKETFLMSRNPIKKIQKCTTFPKIRAEENSETSSEFPASSPSNTQLQKKPQQSQRPPLLKNTLPADAFERGLALIAAHNPPMTVYDKIRSWECAEIKQLSDVEDVINFEELLKARECSTKRLPTRAKTTVAGESYSHFSEFLKQIANLRAPATRLRGSDSKQKSKLTSEDDEKPTTSNCLIRNRDAPLKKRPTKYKRAAAADPQNEALIPKKKSSSSGTPKQAVPPATVPNAKKKIQQQQKLHAATAAGDDAGKVRAGSSAASSQAPTKNNSKTSSSRVNSRQVKSSKQQTKISAAESTKVSSTAASSKRIAMTTATTPTKEDQEAFFRWRRLSREIDKASMSTIIPTKRELSTSVEQGATGLIQIRYDFIGPNESTAQDLMAKPKPLSYNVVVKPLKQENQTSTTANNDVKDTSTLFKTPLGPLQKLPDINSASKQLKSDFIFKDMKPLNELIKVKQLATSNSDGRGNVVATDNGGDNKNGNHSNEFSVEFHQQHEFCNYLGLTGMSTANAMANAAAELSKCNVARRSLRVRKIEIQKTKASKYKPAAKLAAAIEVKANGDNADAQSDHKPCLSSGMMENTAPALYDEEAGAKTRTANDKMMSATTASTPLVQLSKERETKIQILCQITASSKKEEDEACKKCVEKITEPIRRTLLEQYKRNCGIAKSKTEAGEVESESAAEAEAGVGKNEVTKFIELTSKTLDKANAVKVEMQTLHEKVQRCLEESRQNAPNIFIVKSLNNLKDPTNAPNEQIEKVSLDEEVVEVVDEDDDDEKAEVVHTLAPKSRLKAASRMNKANRRCNDEAPQSTQNKKRKSTRCGVGVGVGGGIRKATSNLNATRRLYTRSMLNLNQQRELRNRKVILKLLKTYSGLRIKVNREKKKAANSNQGNLDSPKNSPSNKTKRNSVRGGGGGRYAGEHEVPVSSEETAATPSVTTIFMNKLLDSSSANTAEDSCSASDSPPEALASANAEVVVVDTTNDLSSPVVRQQSSKGFETKTIYENEHLTVAASSSRTLTPTSRSTAVLRFNKPKDGWADAWVQTDADALCASNAENSTKVPLQMRNEVDVVSSSDVVTSTTMHIGEHHRPAAAASDSHHNPAVANELYRNFSFTAESNANSVDAVAAAANVSASLVSGASVTERNPIANASVNDMDDNINDLGIHVLSEPSRALRNPLKTSDGLVLYLYYEDGLLIAVQETLISFWKYSRILNALTVKLEDVATDAKIAKCPSIPQDLITEELQSSAPTMGFRSADLEHMSSTLVSGSEWFYLGERKRLTNDVEIESPFINRLCFNDSRPVYVEMRCRELLNDFRECNLLSCYVNVYFFNEEDQVPCFHSIQLDSIQSAPRDVLYTTIFDSRYFVLAWPQANVLGKVRSGICKYALTPELDMLATTRDFKAMRHALRSLECLKDGKLLGFGDSQLTVWDHRSGDVLMNYDLSMPLGRNLGTIYYHGLEDGQDNVVIMVQHVSNEVTSDLVMIACTISHTNPSRRIIKRHRLPTPAFCQIRRAVNNGEHFVITSETDEELWISCNDPRQLIFIPAQRSQRFYAKQRTTLIELTHQTLIIDSFSNYLLKIAAAGMSSINCKRKSPQKKSTLTFDENAVVQSDVGCRNTETKTNWTY